MEVKNLPNELRNAAKYLARVMAPLLPDGCVTEEVRLMRAAADEIEQLRAEIADAHALAYNSLPDRGNMEDTLCGQVQRLREEIERLQDYNEARYGICREAADEIERLRAIVEQCSEALNVVAVGIWRDKRSNTCGLTGASAAVHAVEFARKAIRAAEAAREK